MTVKAVRIKNPISSDPEKDREVRLLILITTIFASSMIIGAGCVNFIDNTATINKTIDYLLSERNKSEFIQLFINSFILNFIYLSAKGIGYYLLNIVPSNLISVSGLILTTVCSIQLTIDITMGITDKKTVDKNNIRNFIIKFLIISVITAFASFIDVIFCKTYSYLFLA